MAYSIDLDPKELVEPLFHALQGIEVRTVDGEFGELRYRGTEPPFYIETAHGRDTKSRAIDGVFLKHEQRMLIVQGAALELVVSVIQGLAACERKQNISSVEFDGKLLEIFYLRGGVPYSWKVLFVGDDVAPFGQRVAALLEVALKQLDDQVPL